ncbi:MAG: tRNA epoxyqueuosine(34) reductase QueG [bacterium]
MIHLAELAAVAERSGFALVGVAPVEPAGHGWFAPHGERLQAWIGAGHHADMRWIAERLPERLAPGHLLPGVQSALVFWLDHRTPTPPRPDGPVGRVAAYAWGRDYHNIARKELRRVRRWLLERCPGVGTYLSVDTGAVLERAFGERAAVGWMGRSTMLIHPRRGTFGSLAVMFVDQPLPAAAEAHPGRCGTCVACVDACPTGALGPWGLDARRCISYWTIEHRGLIPAEVRPWLGEWVFGCDICQDVCPWNRDAPRADPARWRPEPDRAWPDLPLWILTPDAALEARLEGSPLRRATAAGLRRNALIVVGNLRLQGARTAVVAALSDPDPVVRATAVWAARSLGVPGVEARAARDPSPVVQAEASTPLPPEARVR